MIVQKHSRNEPNAPAPLSLGEALAAETRCQDEATELLRLELSNPDRGLVNDEIVARIRGMLTDLAKQIVLTETAASGQRGVLRCDATRVGSVRAAMDQVPGLLQHCHALAIEYRLTRKLEKVAGIDPVLSPLLQALIGSDTPGVAEAAMAALTAQARFGQTQSRMELPLNELPADLFHAVLLAWKDASQMRGSDTAIRAEARLRNAFDEGQTRLSLLSRLTVGLCEQSSPMPDVIEAGVAIFLTVLAGRSQQSRDRTALSSASPQACRLAIALRATGLAPGDAQRVLHQLDPQAELACEIAALDPATARALLAERVVQRAEV